VQGLREELQEWFQHSVSSSAEQERRSTERRRARGEAQDTAAARAAAAAERRNSGRGHAAGREGGVPDPAVVERATARVDAARAELRKRAGGSAIDGTSSLSKAESGIIGTTGSQPSISPTGTTQPSVDDSVLLATLDPIIKLDTGSTERAAVTRNDSDAANTQAGNVTPIDELRFAELLFAQPGVNAETVHEDPATDQPLVMDTHHQPDTDVYTSFSSSSSETGEFIVTPEASDDEFDVGSATESLARSHGGGDVEDMRSVLSSEDVWSETGSQMSGTSRT